MVSSNINLGFLPDIKNPETGKLSELDKRNPYKLIEAANITKARISHAHSNNSNFVFNVYMFTSPICPEGKELVKAIKDGANIYEALAVLNEQVIKNRNVGNKEEENKEISNMFNCLDILRTKYSPYTDLFSTFETYVCYQSELNDVNDGKLNKDPIALQERVDALKQECINMAKEFDPHMLLLVARAKRKVLVQNNIITPKPEPQSKLVSSDEYKATIRLESFANELIRKTPTSQSRPN